MSTKKIILDLCGGSGAWGKPYAEKGYDVRNITLPGYNVRTYQPPENVYGILSAPPCTQFSFARTTARTPRDLKEGMKLVIDCLKIIWTCRYKDKLAFWCLENPTGYLRQFLGKPVFTFQPSDFGDKYTKKTDLWGFFNIPKMNPTPLLPFEKLPSITKFTGSHEAERRSITPRGFAKAFFEVNQ